MFKDSATRIVSSTTKYNENNRMKNRLYLPWLWTKNMMSDSYLLTYQSRWPFKPKNTRNFKTRDEDRGEKNEGKRVRDKERKQSAVDMQRLRLLRDMFLFDDLQLSRYMYVEVF